VNLEKKYLKLKRILKEFQQREADLLHREEYYLQVLQEKDTEYNALVKALKDRVRRQKILVNSFNKSPCLLVFIIVKSYICSKI